MPTNLKLTCTTQVGRDPLRPALPRGGGAHRAPPHLGATYNYAGVLLVVALRPAGPSVRVLAAQAARVRLDQRTRPLFVNALLHKSRICTPRLTGSVTGLSHANASVPGAYGSRLGALAVPMLKALVCQSSMGLPLRWEYGRTKTRIRSPRIQSTGERRPEYVMGVTPAEHGLRSGRASRRRRGRAGMCPMSIDLYSLTPPQKLRHRRFTGCTSSTAACL